LIGAAGETAAGRSPGGFTAFQRFGARRFRDWKLRCSKSNPGNVYVRSLLEVYMLQRVYLGFVSMHVPVVDCAYGQEQN
jgi:hypothetical protein